jgi:hypothetical protein
MGHDTFAFRHKTDKKIGYLRDGWEIYKVLGCEGDGEVTIKSSKELLERIDGVISSENEKKAGEAFRWQHPVIRYLDQNVDQGLFLSKVRDELLTHGKVDILFWY